MIYTHSAGGIVLNNRGEVLVVNQYGTSWSLPKGHVEQGEDFMSSARREILEEAGITDLEFICELGTYQRYKIDKTGAEDKNEFKTIVMYLFRTKQDEMKPIDPENPEARWVERESVGGLLTHPKDKEFWLEVLAKVESEIKRETETYGKK